MEVAIERARMYNDCGPDGFLIHSKKKTPDEIFKFADEYHKAGLKAPLVCVPTTYNEVTIDELSNVGYSLVIYANYSIRAAVKSIEDIFSKIIQKGTLSAANDDVVDIVKALFDVVPPGLKEHGKAKIPWPNVDAASGSLLYYYGLKEFNYYTVLFSLSRAMGIISQIIINRALRIPITRPKSVTTDWLKNNI